MPEVTQLVNVCCQEASFPFPELLMFFIGSVLVCLQVGQNGFCSDPLQMSSPGWAPLCQGHLQWETFSLSLCFLGDLRGLAQPGAPWLRRGLDYCHQFAGGDPHLPAASCAALEGECGNCGSPRRSPSVAQPTLPQQG